MDGSTDSGGSGGQSGGSGGLNGGSGGKAGGSGGSVGSGGSSGSGGTVGGTGGKAGGSGGAGTGGKDGGGADTGPDGGLSCVQIESMYAKALMDARSCNPRAADQCQKTASSSLTGCFTGCLIPVNDNTVVNQLKAEWSNAGCEQPRTPICPNIACLAPKGVCQPAANDGAASCINQGLTP
jgi:hypothetical protein